MAAKRRNGKSGGGNPSAANATDAHERGKDFLNESEMDRLLESARKARHGARDHLLLLMMHGLRVSEAVALWRDDVNLDAARLWVRRLKNSLSVEHAIAGAIGTFTPQECTNFFAAAGYDRV